MQRKWVATAIAILALTVLTAGCDWVVAGGNIANTKFQTETGLNTATIGSATRHWVVDIGGQDGSKSVPVVATIDKVQYVFVHTSNGKLEKRRADNGALVFSIDIPGSGEGNSVSPTSSPAIVTPTGTTNTQVVVGTMDGHVMAYDARTAAPVWQFPTTTNSEFVPVLASPTVTPGGNIVIPLGETIGDNAFRAFYAIWRFDPHHGTPSVVWGLGSALPATGYEPSSVAIDGATGRAFVGLPGQDLFFPDSTSGVLAVDHIDGFAQAAWTTTWENGASGISATPAFSGGRVFVSSQTGLRALSAASGAIVAGPVSNTKSQFSSPAVAGDRVYAGTDNGFVRGFNTSLGQVFTSGQNFLDDGTTPSRVAAPVVNGKNVADRQLVIASYSDGDVRAFDADGNGSISALWVRHDHGTGKGGISMAGNRIFVIGNDGKLRAFGL